MAQILKSKKAATKFQILVEIAANQPNIQQKKVAKNIDITPQAVSEYIKELVNDGFIISSGRSMHSITKEGTNWILEVIRELQEYVSFVQDIVQDISICTAVADSDFSKGQKVNLKMKNGLLYAFLPSSSKNGASGVCVSEAKSGEDVGVSEISGIIEFNRGKVTICKVPNIQNGGSKCINEKRLGDMVKKEDLICAIGIESFIALKKIGYEPNCFYGAVGYVIESSKSGLSSVVLCVEEEIVHITKKLEEYGVIYSIFDLSEDSTS